MSYLKFLFSLRNKKIVLIVSLSALGTFLKVGEEQVLFEEVQDELPDGHSGLLTFGVLIFGVGGSGFRMFGVSDVGGSDLFSDIRGFWCF